MKRSLDNTVTSPSIAITGGGSAGHVLPAIAVAQALTAAGAVVEFYGRPNSIEEKLVRQAGLCFQEVPASGLRRYRSIKNLMMPLILCYGVAVAVRRLAAQKPRVLFSKGSFASVPVALAASLLRIPIVVHESDHSLGLANRIVGQLASTILLSFGDTTVPTCMREKSRVVGELVRPDLADGEAEKFRAAHGLRRDHPVLLVYGGSSGAQRINSAIRKALEDILPLATVVHVVGHGNLDGSLHSMDGYFQFEFLAEDMVDALWLADVVVSRAGANTVAELGAIEKQAILIPLPLTVSRGDQFVNAQHFVEHHNGEIVYDEDLQTVLRDRLIYRLENLPTTEPTEGGLKYVRDGRSGIAEILLSY